MAKSKEDEKPKTPRILNRRARHDFHILEVLECGVELTGTEVKSLRAGQGKIDEAYVRIQSGELYLVGMNIAMYPQAAPGLQHEPTRDRRLLVHRRQLAALQTQTKQKGSTMVPLAMYFKRGWAKCEIGLAIGKKQFDKRQDIKKRDDQRDISRAMNRRNKDR